MLHPFECVALCASFFSSSVIASEHSGVVSVRRRTNAPSCWRNASQPPCSNVASESSTILVDTAMPAVLKFSNDPGFESGKRNEDAANMPMAASQNDRNSCRKKVFNRLLLHRGYGEPADSRYCEWT